MTLSVAAAAAVAVHSCGFPCGCPVVVFVSPFRPVYDLILCSRRFIRPPSKSIIYLCTQYMDTCMAQSQCKRIIMIAIVIITRILI